MINSQLKIANNEREGMRYPAIDELFDITAKKPGVGSVVACKVQHVTVALLTSTLGRRPIHCLLAEDQLAC